MVNIPFELRTNHQPTGVSVSGHCSQLIAGGFVFPSFQEASKAGLTPQQKAKLGEENHRKLWGFKHQTYGVGGLEHFFFHILGI